MKQMKKNAISVTEVFQPEYRYFTSDENNTILTKI